MTLFDVFIKALTPQMKHHHFENVMESCISSLFILEHDVHNLFN
jgi:hypothetical protein